MPPPAVHNTVANASLLIHKSALLKDPFADNGFQLDFWETFVIKEMINSFSSRFWGIDYKFDRRQDSEILRPHFQPLIW